MKTTYVRFALAAALVLGFAETGMARSQNPNRQWDTPVPANQEVQKNDPSDMGLKRSQRLENGDSLTLIGHTVYYVPRDGGPRYFAPKGTYFGANGTVYFVESGLLHHTEGAPEVLTLR